MTSGQKIAFSLLTAIALFAVLALSLNFKLFNQLETKYYTQSKIEENVNQLNNISESCDSYILDILNLVEKGENAWLKQPAVRSYYVQNPSESEVAERRKLTEQLLTQIPALKGIRIVDKNARNVHFSTFDDTDILKQTGITKIYKNYPDIQKDADELSFEILEKNVNTNESSLMFDEQNNRLILLVPFSWIDGVYSGICIFYFNIYDLQQDLISKDILSVGQNISLFAQNYKGGFVFNIPSGAKSEFKEPVVKYWNKNSSNDNKIKSPEKLLEMKDGRFWVILSSSRKDTIRISGVYTSDNFELSQEIRILIYVCIFISILLVVFLIFSFKRDPVLTLKKRIKKIQFAIVDEYLESKDKVEWNYVANQLKARKKDFTSEILKSLNVHSKKRKLELNSFLEQNWDDIFSIFESKAEKSAENGLNGATIDEIRKVLEEVLQNTVVKTAAPVVVSSVSGNVVSGGNVVNATNTVNDAEEVEEIEEVEELAEEVEEIEEVEELVEDVEEIEEVEELAEDVEEIEEVEELADDVEEIEEVEELAEDVEEIEEVEELTEDVEEIEEVEELAEDVEEIEEVEELAEDVEEIEEVEELAEDVEEIEEVEELAEDVEEIEEVEELADDVEEIEEVADDIEDAEEVINDVVEEVEEEEFLEELEEENEELEGTEEYEQKIQNDISPMALLAGPVYEYKPSNDTYFESEDFATVDNIFAEKLCLGEEYLPDNYPPVEFTVYEIPVYEEPVTESVVELVVESVTESVEELESEPEIIPDAEPVSELEIPTLDDMFYSLTPFGDNVIPEAEELESVKSEDTIIERDGVFSISENLEYSDVKQNPDFKALVDSVL